MHYFKKNIGDYYKKAGRLNMLQHGAYSLLIDACYDREKFPTIDEAIDWAWASTTEEIDAVKFVLSKFFTLDGGVYRQSRIAEEIAEYQEFRALQSQKGKKGGRPKKADGFLNKADGFLNKAGGKPVESHCKADESLTTNHKPLTTNHQPETGNHEPPGNDFVASVPAKRKTKTNNHSSQSSVEDHELANFIWEKIDCLAAGQKKPNLATWANDLRKMRTLDGRTVEEIKDIFIWANTDSFWQSNIRSPKKLRDQFDHLKIKRKSNGSGGDKSQDAWERARKEFLGESAGNVIDGEFSYD